MPRTKVVVEEVAPKVRGRKPKAAVAAEPEPAPKKRGRPAKVQVAAPEPVAEPKIRGSRKAKATTNGGGAIAVRESQSMTPMTATDLLEQHSGLGLQNVRQEHLSIPFLYLLQMNSPATMKKSEQYIAGAEPGFFVYTADGSLFEEVEIIPVHFEDSFQEWWPRDSGKSGLVGMHSTQREALDAKKYEGTEIVQSFQIYCLVNLGDEGSPEWVPALFPCSGAKLRPAKAGILTKASTLKMPSGNPAPFFAKTFFVESTLIEQPAYSFYSIVPRVGEWVTDVDLIARCVKFAQSCIKGEAKIDYKSAGIKVGETQTVSSADQGMF